MLNLRQCWWPEVSTWWPFSCSQSSHLWASLLSEQRTVGSSEQSRGVPLPLQLLSSLRSMPRKIMLQHLSASLLSMAPTQDTGSHLLIYSAVSFRRNCRVGTAQGCPMEKGRYRSNSSWCSTGIMLIYFPQCHGFFGECDLIGNCAVLHFGDVEGLDFRSDSMLQEWKRWFYTFLSRVIK